jgi:uncharacterized protein
MNRFTYFEFMTDNPEKTAAFYREVFGWDVQKWNGPVDYWLVKTGNGGDSGIDGGLMLTDGKTRGTVNTVEVDNLDAVLAKAVAHGGEVILEKQVIPGIGYQAYFKDNGGIVVGLHQTDPKAGS